ncbi:MAG: peptidase S8 [Bryobacteraceae bacterium]|nr:MAG: peptidase S8 [Bryobacteraceae bacterium]
MPRSSRPFDPSRLKPSLIDLALQDRLETAAHPDPFSVLLELRHGANAADLLRLVPAAARIGAESRGLFVARLTKGEILDLARRGREVLYRIWLNHPVRALSSLATIQADAALAGFGAAGQGIVWAVADSGVAPHAHFDQHRNLELPAGVEHRDFTGGGSPLTDEFGHGTHVAGIIAGCAPAGAQAPPGTETARLRGVAPEAKIVSLKVLGADGAGEVSSILAALDYVQQVNDHGRRLLIHGVNLSLGYEFDPEWFACGASPLCREIDRLVMSGVSVVVAAGNSGYGWQNSMHTGVTAGCLDLTINDPGNAELAITVGSTHRERPHTYGVSYFSSKGPTGDGRMKPDLVAPGERIVSCAAPAKAPAGTDWRLAYVEDSGTSMAAPHVSGAVAAFLSVRREFIGRPLDVKEIFLASATDLRRAANFQGRGLVNLFRALQLR